MTQRRSSKRTHLASSIAVLAALALGLAMASVTLASPAPVKTDPPRPTLTPTAPAPSPEDPEGQSGSLDPQPAEDGASPALPDGPCESICGSVLDLASLGGEPGVAVDFGAAGWSVDARTDDSGRYAYGRLGQDVGFVNVVPSAGSDLRPATHDIALVVPPGQAIVVNLGTNRGADRHGPLVAPELSVSAARAAPGEQVAFTAKIRNSLGGTMSRIWITDLLPAGLALSGVSANRGDVVRSGSYAAVNIDGLAPGESATIVIYADVSPDAPRGTVRNVVSLIYAEHAAAQAVAAVTVGSAPAAAAPVSAEAEQQPAGAGGPDPEAHAVVLPTTGLGYQLAGAGVALLLVLFGIRRLRLHRFG